MIKPLAFKGEKKSRKRKALSAENLNESVASGNDFDETCEQNDTWVSAELSTDIIGPVMFALPSCPPSFIACDANGKVFASEIENIVERDLATAEPHDVRQVWVAIRAAGMQYISFKSYNANYLSCDNIGVLSAMTKAISPEEYFLCLPTPGKPGNFSVQTERGKFLVIAGDTTRPEISGDADTISFNTTFHIRIQARFKPKLKVYKEVKARKKVGRKELEDIVGRKLEDEEVKMLKQARVQGNYHEVLLDVKVRGKHDKYAS